MDAEVELYFARDGSMIGIIVGDVPMYLSLTDIFLHPLTSTGGWRRWFERAKHFERIL